VTRTGPVEEVVVAATDDILTRLLAMLELPKAWNIFCQVVQYCVLCHDGMTGEVETTPACLNHMSPAGPRMHHSEIFSPE
jgi:hypothetical protein